MPGGYICASCRRRLLQNFTRPHRDWRRAASSAPPQADQQAPSGTQNPQREAHYSTPSARNSPSFIRGSPIQQPHRSVEEDFIQRLLAGRKGNTQHGPYSGSRAADKPAEAPNNAIAQRDREIIPEVEGAPEFDDHIPSRISPLKRSPVLPRQEHASPDVARRGSPNRVSPTPVLPQQEYASPDVARRGSSSRASPTLVSPSLSVHAGNLEDRNTVWKSVNLGQHASGSAATRSDTTSTAPDSTSFSPASAAANATLKGHTDVSPQMEHKVGSSKRPNEEVRSSTITASRNNPASADSEAPDAHLSLLPSSDSAKTARVVTNPSISVEHTRPDKEESEDNLAKANIALRRDYGNFITSDAQSPPTQAAPVRQSEDLRSPLDNKSLIRKGVSIQQRIVKSFTAEDLNRAEQEILGVDYPVADAWAKFLRVQNLALKNNIPVSSTLRAGIHEKMLSSWFSATNCNITLLPSEILKRVTVGERSKSYMTLNLWNKAIWKVLLKVCNEDTSQLPQSDRVALRTEVAILWDSIVLSISKKRQQSTKDLDRPDNAPPWQTMIASENMQQVRAWFSKSFSARLHLFFPTVTNHLMNDFDSAAVISFAVLQKRDAHLERSKPSSGKSADFQEFIAHLLPYSDLPSQLERHASAILEHGATSTQADYVRSILQDVAAKAASLHVSIAKQPERREVAATVSGKQAEPSGLEELFKKRIARTVESRNLSRLEMIWQEAPGTFTSSPSNKTDSSIPVALFGPFLTAFMALGRPNRAVDAWNVMTANKVEPTIAAWDAMLKGCGIAKDVQALHEIWTKMLDAGNKPDAQIWATRIHGAAMSGKWRYAIEAFREMTIAWMEQVKRTHKGVTSGEYMTLGDVDGVPKPNTQTLNGLVVGLARSQKHDELANVLKLAQSLGVKADTYTFNPLIRTAVRSGNITVALRLLEQMQELDIKPDVATFTMMLQSLFSSEPLAPTGDRSASRVEAAMGILREMQRNGLQSNAWTFATLINGLLKGPDGGNIEATYAVMDYMSANKVPLSSQIFTALLTYHFDEQPTANLAAIEALWNRARMEPGVWLDVFFYDRLIEGFARCNETGRMMAALSHAGKRGKTPGWPAMTEVVSALLRASDRARAEEIVAAVCEEQLSPDRLRAPNGEAIFWKLVYDHGLEYGPESANSGMEGTGNGKVMSGT